MAEDCRLCVALVGYAGRSLEKSQLADMPPELAVSIVSIKLELGSQIATEIPALARLLSACRNAKYLQVTTTRISGLAALIPRPLVGLQDVFIQSYLAPGLSEPEFTALIRKMPNLRRATLLPPSSSAVDGPDDVHLEFLSLVMWHCAPLPLLLSRRWTTRSVYIMLSKSTWEHLEHVDWTAGTSLPELEDMRLVLEHFPIDDPAPLLSFISACVGLRKLQLRAKDSEIAAMLPAILALCLLRDLEIYFRSLTAPEHLHNITCVLLRNLPQTLRVLRIGLTRAEAHRLVDLRAFCRARRVAFFYTPEVD